MANMKNLYRVSFDTVEDFIAVSAHNLDADGWVRSPTPAEWILRNALMAAWMHRSTSGRWPDCVRRDSGKYGRDRRAPVRDSAPSCGAVTFPEGSDDIVGRKTAAPGSIDRGLLVVAQRVHAGSARLDLERQRSKLFLVFLRPGGHPF